MYTSIDNAKKAITDLVRIVVVSVKQENTLRGLTKKTVKEERAAVKNLLFYILGQTPTDQQVDEIVNNMH